jgi:hypothetical protein
MIKSLLTKYQQAFYSDDFFQQLFYHHQPHFNFQYSNNKEAVSKEKEHEGHKGIVLY